MKADTTFPASLLEGINDEGIEFVIDHTAPKVSRMAVEPAGDPVWNWPSLTGLEKLLSAGWQTIFSGVDPDATDYQV